MMRRLPIGDIPFPPLERANLAGSLREADDPWALYEATGRAIRQDLIAALPTGYSLEGRRVLDFGCGAGRALRHFVRSGPDAEFWGCDIDAESVGWLQEHLSPPLHLFANDELPPLDRPDESFDLVYAVSVFTHLSRSWSAWLLELHRLLRPEGLLLATFMGEGWCQEIAGESWDEDRMGMLTLRPGQGWELGGPMILHSPWWIREYWGRLFDVVSLSPHGFPGTDLNAGQGIVVLRRKEVRITQAELEALSDDPREATALAHNVDLLMQELEELRPDWTRLSGERERSSRELARAQVDEASALERLRATSAGLLEANQRLAQLPLMANRVELVLEENVWLVEERTRLEERIERLQARIDVIESSKSWRLSGPLRRLRQALRR